MSICSGHFHIKNFADDRYRLNCQWEKHNLDRLFLPDKWPIVTAMESNFVLEGNHIRWQFLCKNQISR